MFWNKRFSNKLLLNETSSRDEDLCYSSSEDMFSLKDINIVPHAGDLLESHSSQLRANVVDRPYPNLKTYIDTHFRLLYEDVMQPYKKGIQSLLQNASGKQQRIAEVRLYPSVKFAGDAFIFNHHSIPDCTSAWRCHRVRFDLELIGNVNWKTSKRLIHGSLVCLWDGGNEFITGITTFSSPDSLAAGDVTLAIATRELSENYRNKHYVMIESVVFFEPYRAVLEALRSFTPETFPLTDYVLGHVTSRRPPIYLENKSQMSYALRDSSDKQDFIVNRPLDFDSWPSPRQLGLDEKQHSSLIAALTSQMSLVQGPPGTGKTFLALQIIRALLANASLWQPRFNSSDKYKELSTLVNPPSRIKSQKFINRYIWQRIGHRWHDPRAPIVVVCLTNHALDQFLEGILKWTDKIVRIGGQSKSESMKDYNLSEVKKQVGLQMVYTQSNHLYYVNEMKSLRESMEAKLGSIKAEMRMLTKEVPSLEDLLRKKVIDAKIVGHLGAEKRRTGNAKYWRTKKKKGKDEDPVKRWLGWENHSLLKRVAREMKMDLNRVLISRRRAKQLNSQVKVQELIEKTGRDISDDDLSDVVDDVTDDDFDSDDDFESNVESGYQQSIASSKEEEEENCVVEQELIDDDDWCDFKEAQLDQLVEIRLFLCSLPLLNANNMYYETDEIVDLPVKQRWQLFSNWRRCYRDAVRETLNKYENSYVEDIVEYREKKGKSLAALCRGASVVGMTTTGAAKNRKLLEALRAKIVVVEEAAEVLESHIICSLTADCQQLIMIGDHQQLRPSVNVHELEKKYNLDVSLFERLINVGIEPNVLGVQHRMRPEIARLITPSIYKDLKNAPSVNIRPNVSALLHDVFFFHHENQEAREESSYYNLHEVDIALNLAAYLVRQMVPQEHITILTTYAAQMHKLCDTRRRRFNYLENVHITVVDNYQGQENEIVILSLVRNNNRSSIGFLATPNRICVALSRARCGFYMIGNMNLLSKNSSLWDQIKTILIDNHQIGPAFPLTCVRHKDSLIMAGRPIDFPTRLFCRANCGFEMKCGHPCSRPCHGDNVPHVQPCPQLVTLTLLCGHELTVRCPERTSRRFFCQEQVEISEPCGHLRLVPCFRQEAAPCGFPVPKLLPCGHEVEAPCSSSVEHLKCSVEVAIQLKCSHTKLVPCGILSQTQHFEWETLCKEMVSKELPCGHTKRMECRRDPSSVDCGNLIEKVGDCGHMVRYRCRGKNRDEFDILPCEEVVKVTLPCGHSQEGLCHSTPGLCHVKVERILDCGHKVRIKCCEKSPRCEAKVMKTLDCHHELLLSCHVDVRSVQCDAIANVKRPLCSHLIPVKCQLRNDSNYLNSIICSTRMRKTLPCGHSTTVQCSKQDEELHCSAEVSKMLSCGHYVELPCEEDVAKVVCSEYVLNDFPCGHSGKMLCTESKKKNKSFKCSELAFKQLPCGHSMDMLCSKDPASETCAEPVEITLDCGHVAKSTCGFKDNAKCSVANLETLPCGHEYPVKCGLLADEVKCDVGVIVTLKCGHDANVPCSQLGEEHNCVKMISKKLACGHSQEMACYKNAYEEVCQKCFASQLRLSEMSTSEIKSSSMIRATLPCGHLKAVPSFRDLSKEICLQPVYRMLNCGHSCMIACSETANISNVKCEERVKRLLPCGHTVSTKCSADNVTCNEMCEQSLGCGHTVQVKCSVPLEKRLEMQCGHKLIRQLPCGHKLQVACGSFEAEKPLEAIYCREKAKKKIPECGHDVETECGNKLTRKACTSRCTKRRKCGHECKLPCSADCNSVQCDELIDLPSSRLSCGHAVKGLCQMRYAGKPELESWLRNYNQCAAICGAKLDCGHRCPGRCSDCKSSHSHAVCKSHCKRTLICGHNCEAQCCVACPPCNKKCAYECVHGPCSKKCCEDCSPCKKPCAWMCPHFKCNHPCSDLCNREPCNEPCPKKLTCGHSCIGLCGELCPPKCPSCSGVSDNFNKADRCVYLECGHWTEVKEMDRWIYNHKEDYDGSKLFRLPCCPECKKPVLKCFRYGDVIKNCYFDLPSIKFEYVQDVPVYDSSIIKSLKFFLGAGQLSSIHATLNQFIKEAEQVKQQKKNVTRDQVGDAVNRSSLMYEWLCLLSDVKRTYTSFVENKKYEFQLEDTEQIFEIGARVMKKIVESRACGPEFCLNLSDLYSRLDLLRQVLVVRTASIRFNIYSRGEVKRAMVIAEKWQEFDEADFDFLEPWLDSIAKDSKLKLKSCALENNEFFARLSMTKDSWKKCLNRNCGAVFSSVRCDKCPLC